MDRGRTCQPQRARHLRGRRPGLAPVEDEVALSRSSATCTNTAP